MRPRRSRSGACLFFMITNMTRALAALALTLAPLTLPASFAHAQPAAATGVPSALGAPAAPGSARAFPLSYAIGQIPVAEESRAGYSRDKFKHWNTGLDPADGCNTRAEVLLAEAAEAPTAAAGCKLSSGQWLSYYDEQEVTDPAKSDIDHMVPSPWPGTPASAPGRRRRGRRPPTTRTPPAPASPSPRGRTVRRPTRTPPAPSTATSPNGPRPNSAGAYVHWPGGVGGQDGDECPFHRLARRRWGSAGLKALRTRRRRINVGFM